MFSLLLLMWIVSSVAITDCAAVYHLAMARNTIAGIEIGVASNAHFNNSSAFITIGGVYLPPECIPVAAGHRSLCNITAVFTQPSSSDNLLTVYVPANSSILAVKFLGDSTGKEWNLTNYTVVRTPGGCNPLTIGRSVDREELDVLCMKGSTVTSLTLGFSNGQPVFSLLDSVIVSGSIYAPFFVASNANCPPIGMIANTVVFLDSIRAVIAAFTTTGPTQFAKSNFDFLGSACPGVGHLDPYGNTFLLRCSATSAFTFDPCHSSQPVINHSISIPYPCSASGVVAWMYTTNNSLVVQFENGTRTQPIVLGDVSEARCVNSKDPRFVYRHVNGSVYVVRIQDGHVTMLGTSACSGPSSSPALCSGLDFTEHKGSFYVGFFDGLTYKMANLNCPGEAPASMGVPFRPDLSTYFVGPDEQSCLCSPQAPTLPPPPSLSQSPSQGTSSFPDTTLSPSSSYSQIQTPPVVIIPVYIFLFILFILFIIAIVIAVLILIHQRFCGKTKSKLCAYSGQEESQRAVTTLVLLPHSSHHSSSSAVTEELEQAIPESGSPANGELATPDSGSSELTTPDSGSSANGVIAVPLPEHFLEPNTVPVEENNEVQLGMSMETGQHLFTCTVHDVVQQDHTKGEDRMNDRVDKMNALSTGAMN